MPSRPERGDVLPVQFLGDVPKIVGMHEGPAAMGAEALPMGTL
ncbi:MAG: hypothetical protein ACLRWP_12605 [Bilophila wadsworthia]